MALNLLDSLSSSAPTTEKSSFPLKNKGGNDGSASDFSQLLSQLMTVPTDGEVGIPKDGLAAATETPGSELAVSPELSTSSTDLNLPPPTGAGPIPASLTAIVLSPNMTAITPSQPAPSPGSLVAFAQSQGLDKHVADWLMNADSASADEVVPPALTKPRNASLAIDDATTEQAASLLGMLASAPPRMPAATVEPTANDNKPMQSNVSAHATLLAGLLSAPATSAPKSPSTAATTESSVTPFQTLPLTPPGAWLMQRVQAPSKTTGTAVAAPANGHDKAGMHSSDLDLTLIFTPSDGAAKSVAADPTPFTPAAWVMAGLSGDPSSIASVTASLPAARWIQDDRPSAETSSPTGAVEGMQAKGGLSSPSVNPGTDSQTPSTETGLSTAERSELHQVQAEKMGQAIGQRMLSEMEKGHWHLKMMLKPANLGHIEVEMRLRNGELDASFTASQAMTRDLLQDGLPKLRDTLTQMGMDVASMNIGGGSSQKNGGEPTPQQAQPLASAAQSESNEAQAPVHSAQAPSTDQDGLDVLV